MTSAMTRAARAGCAVVVGALVLAGCERASRVGTYAMGWQPPRPGTRIDVLSKIERQPGGHVRSIHARFAEVAVDGDRITAEKVHYLAYTIDGQPQPLGRYLVKVGGGGLAVTRSDGALTAAERSRELATMRLIFADPGPRKRLALHRFRIGERYRVPADQADALLGSGAGLTMVLRSARGRALVFEIGGTLHHGAASASVHGTIETDGPGYTYFHQRLDIAYGDTRTHLDQLQQPVPGRGARDSSTSACPPHEACR